jgi:hypothetical protein
MYRRELCTGRRGATGDTSSAVIRANASGSILQLAWAGVGASEFVGGTSCVIIRTSNFRVKTPRTSGSNRQKERKEAINSNVTCSQH